MTLEYQLPLPPSVNQLWKPVNSRFVLSRKYRRWIQLATAMLFSQERPRGPICDPVEIEMRVPHGPGDTDNRLKAALDLMEEVGILEDDKLVDKVRIYRHPEQKKGTCWIRLSVLE